MKKIIRVLFRRGIWMLEAYYNPASLEEALSILDDFAGRARVIAGGTDLVLQLMHKEVAADVLVDISGLRQLRKIREENGRIVIGALSTHTDLSESSLLQEKAPLLSAAAGSVGSLQIRNVGTVGGNIVNAQPAADTAVALLALDATAKVVSLSGEKQVLLEELYSPLGGSNLNPCREILTEISFAPLSKSKAGGAFVRLARRKAVALPVLNVAVVIHSEEAKGALTDARIVMGPVALTPFRARKAEQVLRGSFPGEESFCRAAGLAADEARPRDSRFRGSAAYRKELARVMVLRALTIAQSNLDGQGVNR